MPVKLGEKYFLERVKILLLTSGSERPGFDRKSWRENSQRLGFEQKLSNHYFSFIDRDDDGFITYDDIEYFLERPHSAKFMLKKAFMKNLGDPQMFNPNGERAWECPYKKPPLTLEQGVLGTGLYVSEVRYTEPVTPPSPSKKRYLPGSPRRMKKKRKANPPLRRVNSLPTRSLVQPAVRLDFLPVATALSIPPLPMGNPVGARRDIPASPITITHHHINLPPRTWPTRLPQLPPRTSQSDPTLPPMSFTFNLNSTTSLPAPSNQHKKPSSAGHLTGTATTFAAPHHHNPHLETSVFNFPTDNGNNGESAPPSESPDSFEQPSSEIPKMNHFESNVSQVTANEDPPSFTGEGSPKLRRAATLPASQVSFNPAAAPHLPPTLTNGFSLHDPAGGFHFHNAAHPNAPDYAFPHRGSSLRSVHFTTLRPTRVSQHQPLSPSERKIMTALLRRVPPGSLLTYVNDTPVDKATRDELLDIITNTEPPYTLKFRLQHFHKEKNDDNIPPQLRFEANRKRGELLRSKDLVYYTKEHVLYKYEKPTDKVVEEMDSAYFSHCKHCPKKDAWYLKYHLTMEDESYSFLSFTITTVVFILIGLSTVAFVLETVPSFEGRIWVYTEWTVSILFSVEYSVRIAVCREVWPYFKDPLNLIDFFSILPFWLEKCLSSLDIAFLRVIRIVRLARIFRLLKDPRFEGISEFGIILVRTLYASLYAFYTLIAVLFLLAIIFASIVYTIEMGTTEWVASCDPWEADLACTFNSTSGLFPETQLCAADCAFACGEKFKSLSDPEDGCCEWHVETGACSAWEGATTVADTSPTAAETSVTMCRVSKILTRTAEMGSLPPKPSPFVSIAQSLWWCIVTMFMVGYGEIFPISWTARFVNTVAMLVGLLVLATPVIIMGFEYAVALQRNYTIVTHRNIRKGKDNWENLLDKLNEGMGYRMFDDDSVLAVIKNGVMSTDLFRMFVGGERGWAYMPFETDHIPGTPRMNQWQLFVLYEHYGRKFAEAEKRKANHFRWLATLGLEGDNLALAVEYTNTMGKPLPPQLRNPIGYKQQLSGESGGMSTREPTTTYGGTETDRDKSQSEGQAPGYVATQARSRADSGASLVTLGMAKQVDIERIANKRARTTRTPGLSPFLTFHMMNDKKDYGSGDPLLNEWHDGTRAKRLQATPHCKSSRRATTK